MIGAKNLIALERLAQGDRPYEVPQTATVLFEFGEDQIKARAIADLEFAAQGVGQQLFGQAAVELVLERHQEFSEFGDGLKGIPAWEFASGIDWGLVVVVVAPAADGVRSTEHSHRRHSACCR